MIFEPATRVHIMGVGGAGMSSLAVLLSEFGCVVSGCDSANATMLAQLREFGVEIDDHHDVAHVTEVDVVLWSPAVPSSHPEMTAAGNSAATTLARRDVLTELSRMSRLIGVTGTHGKTTATSMLVHIMAAAGRDDSRLLGAPVRGVGFGGHWGAGDLLAEVDESYGAFTRLTPYALGLLNVEADHLDHYGSLAHLESAFVDVMGRTTGPVVVWTDDPGAARAAARVTSEIITVSAHENPWWRLVDERIERQGARARLVGPVDVDIELSVTGRHNLVNAAVAAALAVSVGVEPTDVAEGLRRFRGAPRRFEHVATWRGMDVVDDYAHLPGEISATVAAARAAGYRRVQAVFQPHRVTRTLSVGADFAPAFDDVDEVMVTDIYTAGEDNPDGVTGQVVTDYINDRRRTPALYFATLRETANALELRDEPADLLLILGAGDVTSVLDYLSEVNRPSGVGPARAPNSDRHFFGHDERVEYDVLLGARTTYRVGGSVAALLTVARDEDLGEFSQRLVNSTRPFVTVGNGSNLLVAEGRHELVVVHLAGDYAELQVDESDDGFRVVAGAALDLPVAARRLASEGAVGFEWAVGVPGTFGGAVAMNAGGHGSDMRASVTRVEVWARGERRWRGADELDFGYRRSALGPGEIVTRVELALGRGDATRARERISEIVRWRREHQPGGANAGSVFRNPPEDSAGRLIEVAGLKGERRGSARISDKHANFIVVDPSGSADDVWALMRHVREVVAATSGIWLESEHRFVGVEATW